MKDQLCEGFDLGAYVEHCERNFIAAVENYKIVTVPSFENILALTMGVYTARYLHLIGETSHILLLLTSTEQFSDAQGSRRR